MINKIVKMDLSGKVFLVMGAGNGMGKSFVEKLAGYGADIGMMDMDIDALIKMETAVNARCGGRVFAIQGSASSPDDVAQAVWQTVEIFGVLHLAINNTGHAEDLQNYLFALKAMRG